MLENKMGNIHPQIYWLLRNPQWLEYKDRGQKSQDTKDPKIEEECVEMKNTNSSEENPRPDEYCRNEVLKMVMYLHMINHK